MRKLFAASLLALTASYAPFSTAQSAPASLSGVDAEKAEELPYIPFGNLSGASPEARERAMKLGESVARDLLGAVEKHKTPGMAQQAQRMKDKVDAIADEAMAEERDRVLRFLGLDPAADTALYVFVSWSMPLELLRSYVIEAMWSGATLVFKGVPPGKEPFEFIGKDLRQLVYGKGASANLSIDPRLFDAYDVQTVPTIVFSKVRGDLSCQGIVSREFSYENKTLSFDVCPALSPDNYYKMSGAVTTGFALQTFIDDNVVEAKPYYAALARGAITGEAARQTQVAFSGKWEDVLTPEEAETARRYAEQLKQLAQ